LFGIERKVEREGTERIMSAAVVSQILFDGMCKVRPPSDELNLKKGNSMFSRSGDWKNRYCLLTEDCDNVATLTVYKSKKILMTSARATAKVCYSIQINSQLTVLAEDKLTNFVFHVNKDNVNVTFSCESKFIRDGWVSAIQSRIQPQRLQGEREEEGGEEEEDPLPRAVPQQASDPPPSLPLSLSHTYELSGTGSVGGGSVQLRREQSLLTHSSGLELDLSDDKPPSKSNAAFPTNRSGNIAANVPGISKAHKTRRVVAEQTDQDGAAKIPGSTEERPAAAFGHPSATLPPKPPLPLPAAEQLSLLGPQSGDTGPLWLASVSSRQQRQACAPAGLPSGDLARGGGSSQQDEGGASDVFFDSAPSKEKKFGTPYSVFDFDSLNLSQGNAKTVANCFAHSRIEYDLNYIASSNDYYKHEIYIALLLL
jgi:hypothetical protein